MGRSPLDRGRRRRVWKSSQSQNRVAEAGQPRRPGRARLRSRQRLRRGLTAEIQGADLAADGPGLITLTTDFGSADGFPASMKGVILGINPGAAIVDVTHEAPPQDIAHASFVLGAVAPYFPRGTVHVAVVDPGVGTGRAALALRAPTDRCSWGRTTACSVM